MKVKELNNDYEIDRLAVNLMQTNRLRWLVEDLLAELANYNTRELDYETARKVKKYLNYAESASESVRYSSPRRPTLLAG